MQFVVPVDELREYEALRLRKTDDQSIDFSMSREVWKQTCGEWAEYSATPVIPWHTQNVTQQDADRVWDDVSGYCEDMIRATALFCAAFQTAQEPPRTYLQSSALWQTGQFNRFLSIAQIPCFGGQAARVGPSAAATEDAHTGSSKPAAKSSS